MLEDMDLELEEPVEEVEEAGERQNRTFIILVAVMGGLLLIGILAFCVWMFMVGQGVLFGRRVAIPPTNTPDVATTAAAEALALAQPSPKPTVTPTASPTPVPPSPTPAPTIAAPQAPPTPTRTPPSSPSPPAQTGIGAYTAIILAAGLILLLVVSRRIRMAPRGR